MTHSPYRTDIPPEKKRELEWYSIGNHLFAANVYEAYWSNQDRMMKHDRGRITGVLICKSLETGSHFNPEEITFIPNTTIDILVPLK